MSPLSNRGQIVNWRPLCVLAAAVLLTSAAIASDTPTDPAKPAPKANPEHPLAPALDLAYGARKTLEGIKDYEAYFEKKELVGKRMVTSKMNLKLREKPFSVYLLFQEPNEGREVIFVEGKNNGMLAAHETGIKAIVGTVSLATNSPEAMDGNRYPISMIGMRKMLDQVIAQWEDESKFGETEVKYYPNAKLGNGIEVKAIVSQHPQKRKQFNFQKTMLYIDKQTNLPVRLEQYAFPEKAGEKSPLVEEYNYSKIKTDLSLTDRDFDTKNPNYAFP